MSASASARWFGCAPWQLCTPMAQDVSSDMYGYEEKSWQQRPAFLEGRDDYSAKQAFVRLRQRLRQDDLSTARTREPALALCRPAPHSLLPSPSLSSSSSPSSSDSHCWLLTIPSATAVKRREEKRRGACGLALQVAVWPDPATSLWPSLLDACPGEAVALSQHGALIFPKALRGRKPHHTTDPSPCDPNRPR